MISLSSGEIANPRRTIPRVAKLIFYRLVGFYVLGVLAVGVICSSDDTRLLGAIEDSAAGAASSPWVIGSKFHITDLKYRRTITNTLVRS
jgi:amino acid transporter